MSRLFSCAGVPAESGVALAAAYGGGSLAGGGST